MSSDLKHKLGLLSDPRQTEFGDYYLKQARFGIGPAFSKGKELFKRFFSASDDVTKATGKSKNVSVPSIKKDIAKNVAINQRAGDTILNTRVGRGAKVKVNDKGQRVLNIPGVGQGAHQRKILNQAGKDLAVTPTVRKGGDVVLRNLKNTDTGSTLKNLYGKAHNALTGAWDRAGILRSLPEQFQVLGSRTNVPKGFKGGLARMFGKGYVPNSGDASLIKSIFGGGRLGTTIDRASHLVRAPLHSMAGGVRATNLNWPGAFLIGSAGANNIEDSLKTALGPLGWMSINGGPSGMNSIVNSVTTQAGLAQLYKSMLDENQQEYNTQLDGANKMIANEINRSTDLEQKNLQLQNLLQDKGESLVHTQPNTEQAFANSALGAAAGGGLGLAGIYFARQMAIKRHAEQYGISEEEAERELERSGQLSSYMLAGVPAALGGYAGYNYGQSG